MAGPAHPDYRALMNLLHEIKRPRQLTVAEATSELEGLGYTVEAKAWDGEAFVTANGGLYAHDLAHRHLADPTIPLDACAAVVPAATLIRMTGRTDPPVCKGGGGKPWQDCPLELICTDFQEGEYTLAAWGGQPALAIDIDGPTPMGHFYYGFFTGLDDTFPDYADAHALGPVVPRQAVQG
jgi:hypothetical protein